MSGTGRDAGSWELGAERSLELLEVARWVGAVRKSGRTGSRGVGFES